MRSAHRPRSHTVAVLVTVICIVVGIASIAQSAQADTIFPPGTGAFTVKVTVNGTEYSYPNSGPGPTIIGVAEGDDVIVDIADAPGGPDVNFARLRVRQCAADREVSNNTEFNPQITNRCSSVTMGDGTTLAFADSGPVPPGTTTLSMGFAIGAGVTPEIEDPVFGEIIPGFECGEENPCKIVVNVEVSSGVGSSNYLGFPIVFGSVPTAPGAPAGVTAVAGDASASVSWTAPADNGGSAVTSYTVTSTPGGFTCTRAVPPLSCTVSGLANGQAYTFRVTATNVIGTGPASAVSNSVTPQAPSTGDLFTGVTPKRILDSRPGSQVGPYNTKWGADTTREVTVAGGTTSVPADADAVTLNVTVNETNAVSFLTAWPKGAVKPNASSLNWEPGWTVPNSVTVKVGDDGKINVFNNLGSTHVIVDVVGYYRPASGAGFTSVQPKRILDSRAAFQVGPYSTAWGPATNRVVTVAGGSTTIPADAEAVVLNVTATDTNADSYFSVWPSNETRPTVSSVNWTPGWTIPNAVTVKVGTGGQVRLYNNLGTVNAVIDVVGYFRTGTGHAFHPQSPARILDSRPAFQVGAFATPWAGRTIRNLDVTTGSVADGADSVLLNVTVTQTSATSFLSVWPNGSPQATVSSLNWNPGWTIPNAVTAKIGTSGQIRLFNFTGSTHVIADVAGWYG